MGLIAEGTGLGSCRVAGIGFSMRSWDSGHKPVVIISKGNCSTFIVLKNFNNKKLVYLGVKNVISLEKKGLCCVLF
jgi:hypothetical protein